jgi:beta-lactamase class A
LDHREQDRNRRQGQFQGSTNDIGIAYGPDDQRVLLSVMTRSQALNPNADPLRPLIAEVTRSVLPWLTGQG